MLTSMHVFVQQFSAYKIICVHVGNFTLLGYFSKFYLVQV